MGPYALIEDGVVLEEGCRVLAHAQILTGTSIGARTVVGRGAVIGGEPQSLGFDPATSSYVRIGQDNVIREHVTIHRAMLAGAATTVGSDNFLMVGCHLGHDTVIGDHNVIANAALFGGHVHLGSHTYIGGGAVFHQFLRVGDHCMLEGNGSFSKDVPHFTTCVLKNHMAGLNSIGLRRAGFSPEERKVLKSLYRLLFREHSNLARGIEAASAMEWSGHAARLLEFVKAKSVKGICKHGG